ncbi:MAG TPA: hypothetical protein VMW76_01850 [Bacteroidales bacterium]|nr:hypothetical protein [Bacteroidales bacterium]
MRHCSAIFTFLLMIICSCEKLPERGTFEYPLLKYHGDAYIDIGKSITEVENGYALCGRLTVITRGTASTGGVIIDSSNVNLGIIITDLSGDLKQRATSELPGFDEGNSICKLNDGSLVCTGEATVIDDNGSNREILVVKTSNTGNREWIRTYGGYGNQSGKEIIECNDSGYLIVGTTDTENSAVGFGADNPTGKMNVYLLKLDSQGDSIWSRSYGFEGDDFGVKVRRDIGDNGYIILAMTDNSETGQAQNNILLFRINNVGNSTGAKSFGSTGNDSPSDLLVMNDGYLILGASGPDIDSNTEILILKLATNIYSQPLFERRINPGNNVIINSICRHPDGFYIIGGGIVSAGTEDMLFYFIDENGMEAHAPHIPEGDGSQIISDVIVDSEGSIVAIGTNDFESSSLITFYKFKPPIF